MSPNMKLLSFLFLVFLQVQLNRSCKQTCEFSVQSWAKTSSKAGLFACKIKDAKCSDESQTVVTNTSGNKRSNSEVEMVHFYTRNMHFLPSDVFAEFPNVEFLGVYNSGLKEFKSSYLKGAGKLTNLQLHYSNVKTLGPKVFAEAPLLKSLELQNNKIETIDGQAFFGLPELTTIYLFRNRVKKMQPTTFSHLSHLQYLGFDDSCVDKMFLITNGFTEVELAIRKRCEFDRKVDNVISQPGNNNRNNFMQNSNNPFVKLQHLISENTRKIVDVEDSFEIYRTTNEDKVDGLETEMNLRMEELARSIAKIAEDAIKYLDEKIHEKLGGKGESIALEVVKTPGQEIGVIPEGIVDENAVVVDENAVIVDENAVIEVIPEKIIDENVDIVDETVVEVIPEKIIDENLVIVDDSETIVEVIDENFVVDTIPEEIVHESIVEVVDENVDTIPEEIVHETIVEVIDENFVVDTIPEEIVHESIVVDENVEAIPEEIVQETVDIVDENVEVIPEEIVQEIVDVVDENVEVIPEEIVQEIVDVVDKNVEVIPEEIVQEIVDVVDENVEVIPEEIVDVIEEIVA